MHKAHNFQQIKPMKLPYPITPARRNSSQHGKDVVRAIILAAVSAGGAWILTWVILNLKQFFY